MNVHNGRDDDINQSLEGIANVLASESARLDVGQLVRSRKRLHRVAPSVR